MRVPENTFRLHTLDDALRIKKFLSEHRGDRALVVGGGFITLELVEILARFGWKIKLLCVEKSFWSEYLDEQGFSILLDIWQKNGVELSFGDEIADIESIQPGRLGREARIITRNGARLSADFIGVGIGLERSFDAEVNERLETAFPNVWAAGDVAFYTDPYSGRKRFGGNWSGAFMQGRIAGLNMAGVKEPFKTLSAYSINHLGLTITFAGDVGPFDPGLGVKSSVVYFNRAQNQYFRIFENSARVIGAAMINGQQFLGRINQAIINQWDSSKIILD